MAALPGSPEYYKLPVAQRAAEYNRVRQSMASRGEGTVPIEEYMTPMETQYLQGVDASRLAGWQKQAAKKFPLQSAYIKIPEIAHILHQATLNKQLPSITQQQLEASVWWKSHSDKQRSWHLLNAQDPASARDSVNEQMNTVLHQARSLGIHLTASQAMQLSIQALSLGWNDQQLLDATLENAGSRPSTGQMGATRHELKSLTEQFALPVSGSSLDDWTTRISAGTEDLNSYRTHLAAQARSRYQDPGIHAALDQGHTVKEYWQPYAAMASQTLGLNENDIDLTSQQWRTPLDYRDDKGNRRSMTLDEWERTIKTDKKYGYDTSKNGIGEAATLVNNLRSTFGVQ